MPTPRKTDTQKLLEGNRGKRALRPELDATIEQGTPSPPPSMKGEALAQWRWLCSELNKRRVLTTADRGLLILTCEAWEEYARLRDVCRKKRSFTFKARGVAGQEILKRNVEFELRDRAEKKYFRYLAEFGLTATIRDRVRAASHAPNYKGVARFFQKR